MRSTLRKQTTLVPAGASVDNATTMEASAARRPTRPGPRVPARLLRLASDERLVEHVRGGSERCVRGGLRPPSPRHPRVLPAHARLAPRRPRTPSSTRSWRPTAAHRLDQRDPAAPRGSTRSPATAASRSCAPAASARSRTSTSRRPSTSPRRSSAARTCATCCTTCAAARRAARRARPRRARRRLARGDRPGPRRPAGEGQGARLPGALVADRQPRRARHVLRGDPRPAWSALESPPRRGADEVGGGMGQRGREGGLAETIAAQRLSGTSSPLGGGADAGMDRPTEEDEQRLRKALCERRSVRVRCDDSPYDEAARPSLRTFHTASPRARGN